MIFQKTLNFFISLNLAMKSCLLRGTFLIRSNYSFVSGLNFIGLFSVSFPTDTKH